jgi:hypothetical protein
MNCKKGDLAVIVVSRAGNEGRIVRCVSYVGHLAGWIGDDRWLVDADRPLQSMYGRPHFHARDCDLRPIRPGDISDEEVRDLYAPKQKEPA